MTEAKNNYPVFRIVDGKRVQIPDNVRDPNRRYSLTSTVQTGEQYYLEYTDEQERQRDEEERKWEEERPLREAERRRQQEEFDRFCESLVYEKRIVAFIDVLGWSEAIAQSVEASEKVKSLGVALNSLSLAADIITGKAIRGGDAQQNWPGNPQVTQFSDSIVLSIDAEGLDEIRLHWCLRSLMIHFRHSGLIVRGGVTVGSLIHRDSMVFGPALIRAYELESKFAKVPRIILDESLSTAWGIGPSVKDIDGNMLGYMKHWRQDKDGWWFFDFLQPLINTPGTELRTESVNAEMMPWRTLISESLERFRDSPKVMPKYVWLAQYFDIVLSELTTCTLDPIKTRETLVTQAFNSFRNATRKISGLFRSGA